MNGMPSDFFSPEFYQRRRQIIENRLRELENSDIVAKLTDAFHKHKNKPCRPIENWNKYSIESLVAPLAYINKTTVLGICQRLIADFAYNRAGLPDLIVFRQGEFFFAEVKSSKDKLSEKQKQWHDFLSTELNQKVELVLINHTERQIENLKKASEKKGVEVRISFGHSSSKKLNDAIQFASLQPSYSKEGEGKEAIHSAVFSTKEIKILYEMLDLTSGWKSQKIEINGEHVKSTALRNSLYCYRQKTEDHASDDWCKVSDRGNGKRNPFQCKNFYFNELEYNHWEKYGYVDTDQGEWVFDKGTIRHDLEERIAQLAYCPLFNPDYIRKIVDKLPDRVNPQLDVNWGFRGQDYYDWIYEDGKWLSYYGDGDTFPGLAMMTGVKKVTKKDRQKIVRVNRNNYGGSSISIDTTPHQHEKREKSGCFVATVVYGSYECEQVVQLRQFRDQVLLRSFLGRAFVRVYYSRGPALASIVERSGILKLMSRIGFDLLLTAIRTGRKQGRPRRAGGGAGE
ncbi:VRR-NUC domain-containing protein [Chitinispirillales bacterium ANBcel5]|uniref:CFI-box-CTERM domain-containing protein n=1 Tax=Cellulosispirillum alkaliphilum TaxID=3039283 RepID=UPI002A575F01|nr:VRR-NUC domain-containing protein [Chitinispirillales bacterium ANBcel5]